MSVAYASPEAVSVVICTYSDARWPQLVRCVRSVYRQTRQPQDVVIVVDHNPELEERARSQFTRASVVPNTAKQGLSGARNTGARAARGEIIAFLDDDAWADPAWLDQLASGFDDPGTMGAGGHATAAWVVGRPSWFPAEFYWVVGCSYRGLPARRAPVRNPLGCNMAFRRIAFERVGGFRSDFGRVGARPIGVEETEFSVRVQSAFPGSDVLYIPEALVYHEVPAQRGTWSYFIRRCYGEGLSKAHLRRVAGSRHALSAERRYVVATIPSGLMRSLRRMQLRRSAALVIGVAVTAFGFVLGSVNGRSLAE